MIFIIHNFIKTVIVFIIVFYFGKLVDCEAEKLKWKNAGIIVTIALAASIIFFAVLQKGNI